MKVLFSIGILLLSACSTYTEVNSTRTTHNSVDLEWEAPKKAKVDPNIKYIYHVYFSENENLNSQNEIIKNGTYLQSMTMAPKQEFLKLRVGNLNPRTTYYFNIIAEQKSNNVLEVNRQPSSIDKETSISYVKTIATTSSRFLASDSKYNLYFSDKDLKSWNPLKKLKGKFSHISYCRDRYYVATEEGKIHFSKDLEEWENTNSELENITALTCDDEWLIIGNNNGIIKRWNLISRGSWINTGALNNKIRKIVKYKEKYFILSGKTEIFYSKDPTHFSRTVEFQSRPYGIEIFDFAIANDRLIVVGNKNQIFRSKIKKDRVSDLARDSNKNIGLKKKAKFNKTLFTKVTAGPSQAGQSYFVIAGDHGNLLVQRTNAKSSFWFPRTINNNKKPIAHLFHQGQSFIAIDSTGSVFSTSKPNSNWTEKFYQFKSPIALTATAN